MMNSDIFEKELALVTNDKIRRTVSNFINLRVPQYFFEIPASTSGKYHPSYALGEGGLVRHTKAAIKLATELFELYNFSPIEKDVAICAILLHDTFKCGTEKDYENSPYSVFNHSVIAANQFLSFFDNYETHTAYDLFWVKLIADCIASHMGKWNTKAEYILPQPETTLQKFVHLCDYLTSRKCIEIKFEE